MPTVGQKLRASDLGFATSLVTATGTTTSTTNTPTLTGAGVCGVAFVAPTSGSVRIDFQGSISNSTTVASLIVFEVRNGAVVGSGAVFLAADDNMCLQHSNTTTETPGNHHFVTGLTPGQAYNVQLLQRVFTASTGTFLRRRITVSPAP